MFVTLLLPPIKQIRAHDDSLKWTLRSWSGSLLKNKPQKKKNKTIKKKRKKSTMTMDINVLFEPITLKIEL
jgi:hypothetical protein